jgi:drug/metabolite transporter (DMT)-like permease
MDRRAYFLTAIALLFWSGLASAATLLKAHPPLVTTGFGLLIGGLITVHRWREWEVPTTTRLIGVGGILGYHLLFFSAFAHAPHVAVNLINYLWPLLMVVLAPVVLAKSRWSGRHACAALSGLAGTACVLFGSGVAIHVDHLPGYGYAASAALVWALYSLLSKRVKAFPTAAVGGFCVVSGAGALAVAAAGGNLIPTIHHLSVLEWTIIALTGIGPLGIAFLCWDAALKRGDPRVIGTLAYFTPLLSTVWLLMLDAREWGWHLLAALVLIVGGGALGALAPVDEHRRKRSAPTPKSERR